MPKPSDCKPATPSPSPNPAPAPADPSDRARDTPGGGSPRSGGEPSDNASQPAQNSPKAPKGSSWIHCEADLIGSLGLSRDSIRELRTKHLTRGLHWVMDRGKVMLSDSGVNILVSAAKKGPAAAPGQREAGDLGLGVDEDTAEVINASMRQQGDPETLTVVRTGLPNWRMIVAKTAAGENVVVRTNAQNPTSAMNFRPGMEIRAIRKEHIYMQTGRAPRWPGRY